MWCGIYRSDKFVELKPVSFCLQFFLLLRECFVDIALTLKVGLCASWRECMLECCCSYFRCFSQSVLSCCYSLFSVQWIHRERIFLYVHSCIIALVLMFVYMLLSVVHKFRPKATSVPHLTHCIQKTTKAWNAYLLSALHMCQNNKGDSCICMSFPWICTCLVRILKPGFCMYKS